jgi:hypothetical protein
MKDRRELLKVLGVAGVTGTVWKKPVVDSVMLPAHGATTGVISGGGGGGGDNVSAFLPVLDYLVSEAHAGGNPFPGCAQFHWRLNDEGSMVESGSLVLDILAKECIKDGGRPFFYALTDKSMTNTEGNIYEVTGEAYTGKDFTVRLTMTNPLAGPGQQFGICRVNTHSTFEVFRGETCTANVQECAPS